MKPIKLSVWQKAAIEWALVPMTDQFKSEDLPRIVDGHLVLSDNPDANNALTLRIDQDLVGGLKANEIFAFPERNDEKRFEILKSQRLAGRIKDARGRNTIRLKLGVDLTGQVERFEIDGISEAATGNHQAFAAALQAAKKDKRIVVLELGGDAARHMLAKIDHWCDTWRQEQTQHLARSTEYHRRRLWTISAIRLKSQLAEFVG